MGDDIIEVEVICPVDDDICRDLEVVPGFFTSTCGFLEVDFVVGDDCVLDGMELNEVSFIIFLVICCCLSSRGCDATV